jgi:hypothetical protein
MAARATKSRHRPRELRRRVLVRARVRTGAQWGDARILNVSSRGLLIQTLRPISEGSMVEILRGDHLIIAQVMWSEAGRSGLRAEQLIPVEELLSLERAGALQLIASNGVLRDRRRAARSMAVDPRLRGRAMEFAAVGVIAVSLAVGAFSMAESALASPLARVAAVLGG